MRRLNQPPLQVVVAVSMEGSEGGPRASFDLFLKAEQPAGRRPPARP